MQYSNERGDILTHFCRVVGSFLRNWATNQGIDLQQRDKWRDDVDSVYCRLSIGFFVGFVMTYSLL